MTTPQHSIGSGFGARSTTDEVLSGIDLAGRTAIVTAHGMGMRWDDPHFEHGYDRWQA